MFLEGFGTFGSNYLNVNSGGHLKRLKISKCSDPLDAINIEKCK